MSATSRPSTRDSTRASYLKTTIAAFAAAPLSVGLATQTFSSGGGIGFIRPLLVLAACMSLVVGVAGLLVMRRHSRDKLNLPDLFYTRYSRRPKATGLSWRRWIRPLLGHSLRTGDLVLVRTPDEIAATIDERGSVNHLPFMPEMLKHCGKVFVVDRRIDKINDWLGGNELRRVRNVVTLLDVRCDGSAHGGCQAECQILWHEQWLKLVSRKHIALEGSPPASPQHTLPSLKALLTAAAQKSRGPLAYRCQITELRRVSETMRAWDLRQDLRPLLYGNIDVSGFLVAVLTRIFNSVQWLRGGSQYPVMPAQLAQGPTPVQDLGFIPGEWVRVRSREEIGLTLLRNQNRGMWFGRETLRHCGQCRRVLHRVTQIIDERSGEMKQLKIPVILLEGVTGSGEFLRFVPQNDYVFWREIWLERAGDGAEALKGDKPPAVGIAPTATISSKA